VKLSTLIVKMLNRLIKDKILPREAINILLGKAHIYVQILCSSSALPKLDAPVRRCERLGVGNVQVQYLWTLFSLSSLHIDSHYNFECFPYPT
jgi:hypothetical protein